MMVNGCNVFEIRLCNVRVKNKFSSALRESPAYTQPLTEDFCVNRGREKNRHNPISVVKETPGKETRTMCNKLKDYRAADIA